MLTLAKRYISNAIYNENELITSLIIDSIEERKKGLIIDSNLIDNVILFENEVLEDNKFILNKQTKHKTLLSEHLLDVLKGQ